MNKIEFCVESNIAYLRRPTFDGKNSEFLKSFRITDVVNVPKNKMTDIRKTFGIGSVFRQSGPITVPFNFCIKARNETSHSIMCIVWRLTKHWCLGYFAHSKNESSTFAGGVHTQSYTVSAGAMGKLTPTESTFSTA